MNPITIKNLRVERGINQRTIARKLGLSRQRFYQIENDATPRLNPNQWKVLSEALGVPLANLIEGYTQPQQTI